MNTMSNHRWLSYGTGLLLAVSLVGPVYADGPDGTGRPSGTAVTPVSGRPDGTGVPTAVGLPDQSSQPDPAGKPEDAGKPEGVGAPEGAAQAGEHGRPAGVGAPEDAGQSGEHGRPEDPGRPESPGNSEAAQAQDQGPDGKVWVCHKTDNGEFEIIEVSMQGWEDGHKDHEGDKMSATEPTSCGSTPSAA